jgi:hypothetical protein
MPELQFHVHGNTVRIGDYTYYKNNLEKQPASNVVGLMRYNRRTDRHEFYNPHQPLDTKHKY